MIAILARASLRADKNAARDRLPAWSLNFASAMAQDRLIASAPRPVRVIGKGDGATGTMIFSHAVQAVATAGVSRVPASPKPRRARAPALPRNAPRIKRMTAAPFRDARLSAN